MRNLLTFAVVVSPLSQVAQSLHESAQCEARRVDADAELQAKGPSQLLGAVEKVLPLDDLAMRVRVIRQGPSVRRLESALYEALSDATHPVVYYQAVMDGWNSTHVELSDWVEEHSPRLRPYWKDFTECGVLWLPSTLGLRRDWLADLTDREIRRLARRYAPADAAAGAFLRALSELFRFAEATGGEAVVTARCLDTSVDDSEYRMRRSQS